MTSYGGRRREGRVNGRNARDSEYRIQQRTIFRAEQGDFAALPGDFGFECA
jgi:hypothetical protein